jgi:iron complex transport system substrate-binding protein
VNASDVASLRLRGDPPRRIVCLTEETTEILYALGAAERIVGISAWTCRPPEARERHPIVSAFTGANVERIVALEPDLVVGFSDVQADLARELIRRQLPVLVTNPRSIAEILDVVLLVGRLVGRATEAEELVAGYEERLERIARRTPADAPRPRVYFEEWPDPMLSCIRWVSELIHVAGGTDIFAERSHGRAARERAVQGDEVVARHPDVILASWCGKPVERDDFGRRPGWSAVPAVRDDRIHEIASEIILQPGPAAFTDGLDALCTALGTA